MLRRYLGRFPRRRDYERTEERSESSETRAPGRERERERERIVERSETTRAEPRERAHVHEATRDEVYVEERVRRAPWSPAQIYGIAVGIAYAFLGAFALARAGLGDVSTHVTVGGMHHTQRLALLELALGALMILSGAAPRAGRVMMLLLGSAVLGLGVVLVINGPEALHETLGTHEIHYWVYIATGIVTIAVALMAPLFWVSDRVYRRKVRHR
jgi:hypothetical protein